MTASPISIGRTRTAIEHLGVRDVAATDVGVDHIERGLHVEQPLASVTTHKAMSSGSMCARTSGLSPSAGTTAALVVDAVRAGHAATAVVAGVVGAQPPS
ncbi:hypothetical protein [Blastococcus mobilis]|uniref:hypothetical protein n=1 Tax=Blastococcus mobilis TaxID=1938746 RepID=UPI001595211C|nr:hypothetical protein [Blastococcus mobilis]